MQLYSFLLAQPVFYNWNFKNMEFIHQLSDKAGDRDAWWWVWVCILTCDVLM